MADQSWNQGIMLEERIVSDSERIPGEDHPAAAAAGARRTLELG